MSSKGNLFGRRSFLTKGATAAGLGLFADIEAYPQNVNRNSKPSDLKITDMRIAVISQGQGEGGGVRRPQLPAAGPLAGTGPGGQAWPGAGSAGGGGIPRVLIRLDTNQGISGYGELQGGGEAPWALVLKSRLLGENPCSVDKIFRKIKQFGGLNRQAGGVNAVEIACWDLAGKAYGVPVHQMLGGPFRDKVRLYTETAVRSDDPKVIGADLRSRVAQGFTMLKMDLNCEAILRGKPGTFIAPHGGPWGGGAGGGAATEPFFQGYELSDKGCALVSDYVAQIHEALGVDVPLGFDHFGHIGVNSCIKLGKALQKHNPAYLEDMVPWYRVEDWKIISNSIDVPTLTGEDAYLAESLEKLCQMKAVDYIHPDILVAGGCLEMKKMGDMAQKYSVGMFVHCAASPIGYMAGVHSIAATENFVAFEWHQPESEWYKDLVESWPIVKDGYIPLPMGPGLGIKVNEDALRPLCKQGEFFTDPTTYWDTQRGSDKLYT